MQRELTVIETSVYSRLEWQIRHLLATSGLGLARGPVGIGKSFALEHIRQVLVNEGANVLLVTCTPTTEGSHQAFIKSVLASFGYHTTSVVERLEVFENLVMGIPFGYGGTPSIFMVDECQGMRAPVMTMLRQLWDKGEVARLNRGSERAFALLLCGNNTFLNRSGVVREMDMHPLRDRVTMNIRLAAPDKDELDKIARHFCGDDQDAGDLLSKYGTARGNIRSITQVFREGTELAGNERVSATHIKDAITMIGGA